MADEGVVHPDFSPLDVVRQAELLELAQDAILVRAVRTSAITYWNRGAERLYGWPRDQALGKVTHSLLRTQFPVSGEAVTLALVGRGYWEGELVHTRQDGSQVTVSSRQAIQRDKDGLPIAILEINTDITERKRADEELVRLSAERRARQLAERALDRLSRLQRVTAGLAEALTPAEVARVVVEQGIAALDARAGRIAVARPETGRLDVLAYAGYERVRSLVSLDEHLPTTEVYRSQQPLFLTSWAEMQLRFPNMLDVAEPQVEGALASVPVMVEGRVIGAMTLAFEGDRLFEDDDRHLLVALATQCGQAFERARLYEMSLMIQEDLRRSRDQLTAILGGIAEGVTVQDPEGRLVYANDVAARMSGFASGDELIRGFASTAERFALFDASGKALSFDDLPGRRLVRGQPAQEVEMHTYDKHTGESRWSILDAAPVRDAQGRLQLVVNIFRDVTYRKRQTEATEFLAAASTILGSTLDANLSLQQVAELAVPRIADWCTIDVLEEGHSRRVAATSIEPDDTQTKPMAVRSSVEVPLVTRGQTLGSIGLGTRQSGRRYDQSDVKLAEDLASRAALAIDNARLFREAQAQAEHQSVLNAALRETVEERDRALADLRQSLRTRDEFLASASHDLKNPLASVKATAQLLARRLDRGDSIDLDRMRDGLHRLDSIATRAAGLVDELLDLARVQMGRPLDLDRHPLDLVQLARDVADEHQQATERHTIRVTSREPELVGVWDARRLGRLLSNLLDNATKYSPNGGPIGIALRTDGDCAVLEVTDDGIGIPQADQRRIFDRFQRASNVDGLIGGTGIGLASAGHIVESHGGTIEVRSQEGHGATFSIRLPIEPAFLTADIEAVLGERA